MITIISKFVCIFYSICILASCSFIKNNDIKLQDTKNYLSFKIPNSWGKSTNLDYFSLDKKNYNYSNIKKNPKLNWVFDFRDDELVKYVIKVLSDNNDIKLAHKKIEIAKDVSVINMPNLYPVIVLDSSYARSKTNIFSSSDGTRISSNVSNSANISLNLNWELDLWGKLKDSKDGVLNDLKSSKLDKDFFVLSLIANATKTWFLLKESQAQIDLSKRMINSFLKTEKLISERFNRGIIKNEKNLTSEFLLSKSDVEMARESLESRKNALEQVKRRVEVFIGNYPYINKREYFGKLSYFPKTKPKSLPISILNNRPDILSSQYKILSASNRVSEAKKNFLPSISLITKTGMVNDNINDLLVGNFGMWNLAGSLTQPIFQVGKILYNFKWKKKELDAAIKEFNSNLLQAFLEVEDSISLEKYLIRRLRNINKSISYVSKAYDKAFEEFEKGTGDILTMLTSQRRKFSLLSNLITIKRLRLENRVNLYLSLGGNF